MAFISLNYPSAALDQNTGVSIILPDPGEGLLRPGKEGQARPCYPVLYLLHGTYGDHTDWCRYTSIERYAREWGLAVVMPACGNTFYQDMASGPQYKTFVLDELPAYLSAMLPLSTKREEVYIAGLSMGGYGAMHLALSRPRQFGAAASLSGIFSFARPFREVQDQAHLPWPFAAILGEEVNPAALQRSKRNVLVQVKHLMDKKEPLPALFISVGTEDFTLPYNREAKQKLKALGADFTYEEHPGGHTWGYWDTHIQRVLDWLPLPRKEEKE